MRVDGGKNIVQDDTRGISINKHNVPIRLELTGLHERILLSLMRYEHAGHHSTVQNIRTVTRTGMLSHIR